MDPVVNNPSRCTPCSLKSVAIGVAIYIITALAIFAINCLVGLGQGQGAWDFALHQFTTYPHFYLGGPLVFLALLGLYYCRPCRKVERDEDAEDAVAPPDWSGLDAAGPLPVAVAYEISADAFPASFTGAPLLSQPVAPTAPPLEDD